jgi:hypothetical protein
MATLSAYLAGIDGKRPSSVNPNGVLRRDSSVNPYFENPNHGAFIDDDTICEKDLVNLGFKFQRRRTPGIEEENINHFLD